MIFDKVLGQTTKFEAHCFKAWTQNQLKAAQTPLTAPSPENRVKKCVERSFNYEAQ